ncbi:MAG: hypothetical protein NC347_00350 [Clostridium sp.]|nr:hypothetical protein [Clostridium sp.]
MGYYTEGEEVRVYNGRIGVIDKVIFEMVDGKETDNVYCYEMTIDGVSDYMVYPADIEE